MLFFVFNFYETFFITSYYSGISFLISFFFLLWNPILVLQPLISHPKRMLELLARTVSVQDSDLDNIPIMAGARVSFQTSLKLFTRLARDFKSWMLCSDYGLVWFFYINRLFRLLISFFFFFHLMVSSEPFGQSSGRNNASYLPQGLSRYGRSVPARSLHNRPCLQGSSSSSLHVDSQGRFQCCRSK